VRRNGTLIKLFDITVPVEKAYRFVTPPDVEPTPLLQRFRQGIFSEAQVGDICIQSNRYLTTCSSRYRHVEK